MRGQLFDIVLTILTIQILNAEKTPIRQRQAPKRGVWLSWGWSYEFPVEVEGSRRYRLEPFSKLDVFENPNNIFFEGPSRLINDDTGATVGVAVTESMDVRIMQNAPYAANQH